MQNRPRIHEQPPDPNLYSPFAAGDTYDSRKTSLTTSTVAHLAGLLLVFAFFSNPTLRRAASDSIQLVVPIDLNPYLVQLAMGDGGGGQRSPMPANRGELPRFDKTQIVPPSPVIKNEHARLAFEPTLLGPSHFQPLRVNLAILGNPLGSLGPPSPGPGLLGGVGGGKKGGVGPNEGPGFGPGRGGGISGVYRIGHDVSAPLLIKKVEPEYSEEARKAKFQGTVVLLVEIWPDGRAHNIQIRQSLGLGLDQRAIQAVQQWWFEPGRKDGVPVKVAATIEVNFRLL